MHMVQLSKKAYRVCNAILHSFKSHNVNLYMRAFDSYVQPIVQYCCYVWYPVLCKDIDLIENIQRCFTRRVFRKCNLPRVSYVERLQLLNRSSLEKRRLN